MNILGRYLLFYFMSEIQVKALKSGYNLPMLEKGFNYYVPNLIFWTSTLKCLGGKSELI